ncbi:MAG: DUF1476 domain-containing protein [Alphaproteobacteria bacterium]|nr:DUF1476 domain-containing protein [Alphaproteobacteria bacterium]MBU0796686.1 DUF1476 domain-containing protein [Alphaproteobacteria bacterium]MBU0888235.1 DUF1476 domain-containing protein [Alphaproteobacteria bacterium]MBU1811436.1 DUF1476 domain-containing protein [Alphaproteobacteria bacterium]MBU2091806.1 DUF1476 domain-containing protein [Alphaproteobacteria bacterium]
MSSFSDREQAFENKFKHDAELRFKIVVRRNRLLGLWAAELMGETGTAADDYAKSVVESDFEKPGHDDVVQKLLTDFKAAGIEMTDREILKQMDELLVTAQQQVTTE